MDKRIKSLADAKGKNISVQDALLLAQVARGLKGDARAFELIANISGAYDEADEEKQLRLEKMRAEIAAMNDVDNERVVIIDDVPDDN